MGFDYKKSKVVAVENCQTHLSGPANMKTAEEQIYYAIQTAPADLRIKVK